MTFTVKNKTKYDTAIIKRVFRAVVNEVVTSPQAAGGLGGSGAARFRRDHILKSCEITVVPTRHREYSGRATYSGDYMILRLHPEAVSLLDLIWITHHEVLHLFNVQHQYYPATWMHASKASYNLIRERYPALVAKLPETLVPKTPTAKPKPTTAEKREKKLASIEKRLMAWNSKRKRADTAIKKLTKQRAYYAALTAASK